MPCKLQGNIKIYETSYVRSKYYNTISAVYTCLSVNRDIVKHYEALGLLTTPIYAFALPTHVTALLSTGLFMTRY